MAKILTAERVSRDISDNYVFQRSQLAYHEAARRISGDVLEIGTGTGYGIEIVAPHASSFLTLDKIEPAGERPPFPHVEMRQAVVPPLDLPSGSFDYVISFQVIEHIKHDMELVREVHRVLRPGGKFILTTPNIRMTLTRNPWHVREYNPDQLRNLLGSAFASVEALGVFGNERRIADLVGQRNITVGQQYFVLFVVDQIESVVRDAVYGEGLCASCFEHNGYFILTKVRFIFAESNF